MGLESPITPKLVATAAALVTTFSCGLPVHAAPDWARDRAMVRVLTMDRMGEGWNRDERVVGGAGPAQENRPSPGYSQEAPMHRR